MGTSHGHTVGECVGKELLVWPCSEGPGPSQCCPLLVQPALRLCTGSPTRSATLQGKHYPPVKAKETEAQRSLETRLGPHSDKARIVPRLCFAPQPTLLPLYDIFILDYMGKIVLNRTSFNLLW